MHKTPASKLTSWTSTHQQEPNTYRCLKLEKTTISGLDIDMEKLVQQFIRLENIGVKE